MNKYSTSTGRRIKFKPNIHGYHEQYRFSQYWAHQRDLAVKAHEARLKRLRFYRFIVPPLVIMVLVIIIFSWC